MSQNEARPVRQVSLRLVRRRNRAVSDQPSIAVDRDSKSHSFYSDGNRSSFNRFCNRPIVVAPDEFQFRGSSPQSGLAEIPMGVFERALGFRKWLDAAESSYHCPYMSQYFKGAVPCSERASS